MHPALGPWGEGLRFKLAYNRGVVQLKTPRASVMTRSRSQVGLLVYSDLWATAGRFSSVHPTRVRLGGGGCGSNWLTIVGSSSSKYLEHMLLLGADRRLACSATLVIFGYIYLVGGSRVCTLHLYLWGVVGGAKWLTIVGLSSLKHLERMLFRGADHRLAYSAS